MAGAVTTLPFSGLRFARPRHLPSRLEERVHHVSRTDRAEPYREIGQLPELDRLTTRMAARLATVTVARRASRRGLKGEASRLRRVEAKRDDGVLQHRRGRYDEDLRHSCRTPAVVEPSPQKATHEALGGFLLALSFPPGWQGTVGLLRRLRDRHRLDGFYRLWRLDGLLRLLWLRKTLRPREGILRDMRPSRLLGLVCLVRLALKMRRVNFVEIDLLKVLGPILQSLGQDVDKPARLPVSYGHFLRLRGEEAFRKAVGRGRHTRPTA
jgi:hypothetical protein